ncbi:protein NRT1/ PTR FAMILY 2.7-like [Henckelia pumila]|uniref:protein NRT1/ PTR FAMILY 2.7-like n=1 Tax=Henckelia pumila TaxID=405737 RepID=UPI003C6DE84C
MSGIMNRFAAAPPRAGGRRGGWITFPFIIATITGLMLAAGGWISNLIVYLIQEFNYKSISAAQVFNFVNGSITMFPIVGAIIADSFVGCFSVIWFSSIISLLGMLLILLTAAFNQLRPPACENGSNLCKHPSQLQLVVLYLGLALSSLGNAGTRFTIAPMGADQFDTPEDQSVFFNWYIVTMYTATIVSSTAIVFVEDNVSWTLGFGLCVGANVIGLAVFLSGRRFYRLVKPKGTPFKSLACVIVAAFGKRRMLLSEKSEDYYHGLHEDATETFAKNPSNFFRFLNRAALRTEDTSISDPWKQTTVQQVEDLKTLIKILPLWSTGLFLCIPLAIQLSLTIIQALTMDRHLGSRFKIPAGTMPVFILLSTSLTILLLDRLIFPLLKKIMPKPLTLLQRIGIGHACTVISMAVSALVESRRLKLVRSNNLQSQVNAIVPMSVFWLLPPLALAGIGEGFHFPGNVAFYYQEFPESLKSTSTAAVAMFIGIAFYTSNAIINLIQRTTGWLPDDINHGRLDNVYWFCCIMGAMNFVYYLVCTSVYKYIHVQKDENRSNKSETI